MAAAEDVVEAGVELGPELGVEDVEGDSGAPACDPLEGGLERCGPVAGVEVGVAEFGVEVGLVVGKHGVDDGLEGVGDGVGEVALEVVDVAAVVLEP